MRKKLLSFALSAATALYCMEVGAIPAAAETDTGNFTVTGDIKGYDYSGNVLTITGSGEYTIAMADNVTNSISDTIKITGGATVTLDGVSITDTSSRSPLEVNASADVTIKLSGTNTLTSTSQLYAGLQKTSTDNTLMITSATADGSIDGTLAATGGDLSAGIGGGDQSSGSNITIAGGTITAAGGRYGGAGIGGGDQSSGSNITINGGMVTANGGGDADGGAGIGGGELGSGSNIKIQGGTVIATGGGGSAGIGGGCGGNGSSITIAGGTVTATGGEHGAGIGGGGENGSGCDITINGGAVSATGGQYGAGIGGSDGGVGSYITINGGTVTATGGSAAAGIGTCKYGESSSTITIKGGTVTAVGGAAGIGGCDVCCDIYISPATGMNIRARYENNGSYTVYSTETDVTELTNASTYFESKAFQKSVEWTTGSDAGYYAETADAADKEGIIRFLAKYSLADETSITSYNVKSYGIWFMKISNDSDFESGVKASADTDIDTYPGIYADLTGITNEDTTCYAKAYIEYDSDGDGTSEYMFSDLIEQKADFTKWLGAKTTYDAGDNETE